MANMDKALYQAPVGLDEEESPAELVIVIGEEEDTNTDETTKGDFDANLAEEMKDGVLSSLGTTLVDQYNEDWNARKDWVDTYVKGLKLLGLKYEERSEPWSGACGAFHPILAEAVVKFQAESIMETFPAAGPVKTTIIGKETPVTQAAAARVRDDMNFQLTERMVEYRPEHEKMLWALPLAGSAFKKVYYDPSLGRQVSMFVPAEDMVVPYGSSSLETAECVTHIMRKTANDIRKLQASGFYLDIDLGEPTTTLDDIDKQKAEEQGITATSDDRFRVLEMHIDLNLEGYEDEDEIALPYVVTIEKGTCQILGIRRNWYEDDPLRLKRQHFVHYTYVPGFGFYGFGLIHLVGGFAQSATSILRQLVDAGTLSNLPGGYKTKGLRVKGDDTPIAPGEFRDVDVSSGVIRDNIMPLPYKEPSQTLYLLMQNIVEEGRRFASAGDMQISDMSANTPVGTTLAILERTLKVMSAVQARLHFAMKQEFKLLAGVIRDYTPEEYEYDVDGGAQIKQADYDMCDVIPVSDPNASTMSQKVIQYQAVMQNAQAAPQIYNLPLLHRQMAEVLGVKNANKLVPMDDDHKPMDPVSENMAVLTGKPVKAFQYQDHESHIKVHMSFMQDPKLAQLIGQDPTAQAKQAAGMAHLSEHIAMEYRNQIEKQLGAALPANKDEAGEDVTLPPEIELQISKLTAMAAQQLLQANQSEMQQQQAQQKQQDPIVQMQQQELQIKQKELELKEKKLQTDVVALADKQDLEEKRLEFDMQLAGVKLGSEIKHRETKMQTDAVAAADKQELGEARANLDAQVKGVQLGHQIAQAHKAGMNPKLPGKGV
jgi:hypothetical protein